jgi:DNA repair exonuclease SbcCD ATPase subunit
LELIQAARLEAEIDVCQNALASCKQELSRAISTNERDVKNIKEVTKRFMLEKNELSERINKLMKEGEELKRKEVDARQALDVHAKEIGVTLERYKVIDLIFIR